MHICGADCGGLRDHRAFQERKLQTGSYQVSGGFPLDTRHKVTTLKGCVCYQEGGACWGIEGMNLEGKGV